MLHTVFSERVLENKSTIMKKYEFGVRSFNHANILSWPLVGPDEMNRMICGGVVLKGQQEKSQ